MYARTRDGQGVDSAVDSSSLFSHHSVNIREAWSCRRERTSGRVANDRRAAHQSRYDMMSGIGRMHERFSITGGGWLHKTKVEVKVMCGSVVCVGCFQRNSSSKS